MGTFGILILSSCSLRLCAFAFSVFTGSGLESLTKDCLLPIADCPYCFRPTGKKKSALD